MNSNPNLQPELVARHLQALLQTPVVAQRAVAQDLKGLLVRAEIVDEAGALVCVLLADSAAAGSTGAALSKIPPGAVLDMVRRAQPIDEDTLANFHEVANTLTVLTTALLGRRTILRSVAHGAHITTHEDWLRRAVNKALFKVSVQSYPPGTMGFFYV